MQIGATTLEDSVELPQKNKNELFHSFLFLDQVIPKWTKLFHFWEYNQRTLKHYLERYMHPYVFCSMIYNSRDLETAQVPISIWMDGPGEFYAKLNKSIRERQVPYDFTCMWNIMNNNNKN